MKTTPIDPQCERCGKAKSKHSIWIGDDGERPICNSPEHRGQPFRCRKEDMPGLAVAPHPSVSLGSWVHAKSGARYEVIGGVFNASGEGDVIQVLYQSVADGYLSQRPVAEFAAKFRPFEAATVVVQEDDGEVD